MRLPIVTIGITNINMKYEFNNLICNPVIKEEFISYIDTRYNGDWLELVKNLYFNLNNKNKLAPNEFTLDHIKYVSDIYTEYTGRADTSLLIYVSDIYDVIFATQDESTFVSDIVASDILGYIEHTRGDKQITHDELKDIVTILDHMCHVMDFIMSFTIKDIEECKYQNVYSLIERVDDMLLISNLVI